LKQQAVLFRTSSHSGPLEVELTRRNIPFVKFGCLKFLDAAHVKDLLALLRFVENPRDRVAGRLPPKRRDWTANRCGTGSSATMRMGSKAYAIAGARAVRAGSSRMNRPNSRRSFFGVLIPRRRASRCAAGADCRPWRCPGPIGATALPGAWSQAGISGHLSPTVCPHQWQDPLSLARRRPGGRSPRSLCHQETKSQGSVEVSAQSDETIWPTGNHGHRQAWLLPGSAKDDRQRCVPGDRPLAEQSSGKLTPASQATRTRNAAFSADGNSSEIRGNSFIRTQSFQSGAPSLQPRKFQAEPCRRSRRVARAQCRINHPTFFVQCRRFAVILTMPPPEWTL
jgi:hypothetical protein